MEQMTRDEVVKLLMQHNTEDMTAQVVMYASSFVGYLEAEENISRNGIIVAHPRTGSPIENPYLKIRSEAMREMKRFPLLEGISELWKAAGLA